jgi:hypothetical protein
VNHRSRVLGSVVAALLMATAVTSAQTGPSVRFEGGQYFVRGCLQATPRSLAVTDKLFADRYYDDYTIKGTAGEKVDISVRPLKFDTAVRFYQRDGEAMRQIAFGTGNFKYPSEIKTVMPVSGEYVVRVTSNNPGETGAYVLSISGDEAQQPSPRRGLSRCYGTIERGFREEPKVVRPVTPGQEVRSTLDRQDRDGSSNQEAYAYRASAGERLKIRVKSSEFLPQFGLFRVDVSPLEPNRLLEFVKGSGDIALLERDAHLEVEIPKDGEYVIVVSPIQLDPDDFEDFGFSRDAKLKTEGPYMLKIESKPPR